MVRQISARSVSRPIWDRLTDAEFNGEVMAVFRRTCILKVNPCFAMDESEISIIALVLPEIGDGPLNIVLDENSTLNDIQLGQVACFHRDGLHIGGLYVLLKRASIWEPRPNWDQLRSQYETVSRELEFVLSLARRYAPSTSMLELLSPTTYVEASKPPLRECFAAARRGMKALEIGSKRGTNALQIGVSQLAGLGPGLTPSGDDFLAGVMLCLWLSHPAPLGVCRSMLQVAVHRTTLLSAALLQRASMG